MITLKELISFEKACEVEGLDAGKAIPEFPFFPERHRKAMVAICKLVIIVNAANRIANEGKEWIPDFDNDDEAKYENWYEKVASSGFRCRDYGVWDSTSSVGSRLCFKNREVGKHVADVFIDIVNEWML